jgi:hypothetical protein
MLWPVLLMMLWPVLLMLWPVSDRATPMLWPVSDRATPMLWPVSDRATPMLWPVSDRATLDLSGDGLQLVPLADGRRGQAGRRRRAQVADGHIDAGLGQALGDGRADAAMAAGAGDERYSSTKIIHK